MSRDDALPADRLSRQPVDMLAQLQPDQRALLDHLAAGRTIAAAAAAEFMSLRTANRRVAAVRTLFGVTSTSEAVRAYLLLRRSG